MFSEEALRVDLRGVVVVQILIGLAFILGAFIVTAGGVCLFYHLFDKSPVEDENCRGGHDF